MYLILVLASDPFFSVGVKTAYDLEIALKSKHLQTNGVFENEIGPIIYHSAFPFDLVLVREGKIPTLGTLLGNFWAGACSTWGSDTLPL